MVAPVPAPAYADPTNVIGRRVGAAVMDGVIVFGPALALEVSTLEYLDVSDTAFSDGSDYCDAFTEEVGGFCADVDGTVYFSEEGGGASSLLFFGLAIGMFVLLQGLTGSTVGKRIFGLRCVREDGRAPGIGKAALRSVLWFIDMLPCIPLVGFITSLTTVGHRRVGDMAAKTYVVRADAAGSPVVVPGQVGPGVAMPVPPGAPAAGGWPAPTAAPPTYGAPTAPPPTPAPQFPAPTAKTGPQWDEARNTYIQWDDATKQWVPIR